MSLLSPTPQSQLNEVEDLFQLVESHIGFVPNSLKLMARKPEMLQAFVGFTYHVMTTSQLDAGLKSMISWATSAAYGCRYCQAHTVSAGEKSGMSLSKINALPAFETSTLFTPAERAAMIFAQCMANGTGMVGKTEEEALKAHYSEDQIFDIISIVSYFGFLNRWNDTLATPIEDQMGEFASAQLPGWISGKHIQ